MVVLFSYYQLACFHQLSCRTVPVQIWGADSKIKNDPKVVIYFGSPNQIVRFSQLSLWLTTRKVQTSLCLFSPTIVSNCTSSNLGRRQKIKTPPKRTVNQVWQPQPDSNWCSRLERAVSWASRRWGQNCRILTRNAAKL